MPPSPAVLVTGASTGIGEACAVGLAGAGYRVFAAVRRAEDGRRVEGLDPSLIRPLLLDVTRPEQIDAAARAVDDAVGEAGLAGLVNNAGIVVGGPLEFVSPDDLRRQLEVNVVGLHAVTVAFLPLIRRARGRIVNIGSISGRASSSRPRGSTSPSWSPARFAPRSGRRGSPTSRGSPSGSRRRG